jgi:hypothetical protein
MHEDVIIRDDIIAIDNADVLGDMCMEYGIKNTCEF